ncbi:MAG: alanine--tRNA ligase [Nitrospirae bacterium]|nr:alanine--tRNA ligase [Nitrospirota bacterium]
MTSAEIRKTFLDYFSSKGHEVVPSSSLIPGNDPTLLFTNAGMVQFKSVFLGQEKRANSRAVSSQKCVRAGGKHNDLENVGHTARHHTFFEMLGNFSFGDYFKSEAIVFAWELLTEVYRLPRERLWATVYEEDDEAAGLWQKLTGVPQDRIVRLGAKDNFWQMGDTGPCGPCSEILIDQGGDIGCRRPECAVGCDCDRFLEIWNLVFMQYNRDSSGGLSPLPKPSIDTGMGLERLSSVLQGKYNNFDSDIFGPIIDAICRQSGKAYHSDRNTDIAIRVIADHIRSITFLLSEGLTPSNEGRGYVLRRIIRRAARYAKSLDISDPVLFRLCRSVSEAMAGAYPELESDLPRVEKLLRMEEERFNRTLEQGLHLLNNVIGQVKSAGHDAVPGEELFRLYDTYGFPLDIARDVAQENGLTIDEHGFHTEMEAQKTKARASWSSEDAAVAPVYKELMDRYKATEFVGYDSMTSESSVLAIVSKGSLVDQLREGEEGEVLLDRSPFYAESGGQAGDAGLFLGPEVRAVVTDTRRPVEGYPLHKVTVSKGLLSLGVSVTAGVDVAKRTATMRNHTATHLIHAALRNSLGTHIKQAGSFVSYERLRFDFTHFDALDHDTIEAVEDEVNDRILRNLAVTTTVMETKKAIESGVTALFGEKYGSEVRVVEVPDTSSELCGGTHVHATGDIGLFKILSEGSVASGIRRIEAVTGRAALQYFRDEENELRLVSELLKTTENPSERLRKMISEMKHLEKELESYKGKSAAEKSEQLIKMTRDINGVKVISCRVDGLDGKDLRTMADNVREGMGSGVLLLASVKDDQASMVAMVTKDLVQKYSAGSLLKQVAAMAGGKGGGKPDLAQGGTKDLDKIDSALEALYDIVKQLK